MSKAKTQILVAGLIMLVILLIDQWIKIYIKTHFVLHESYKVTSWFYLSFVENKGMAYGMQLGSKALLTGFRILAVVLFLYYLVRKVIRNESPWLFVVLMSMMISGALGNIIDCIFYGQWFTSSVGQVAQWADPSVGLMPNAAWFHGPVVDMLYFPLIRFDWPEWIPCAGQTVHFITDFDWPDWLPCSDEPFLFFKPVFNFADSCITVSTVSLLLYFAIGTYKASKNKKQHAIQ